MTPIPQVKSKLRTFILLQQGTEGEQDRVE